MISFRFVLLGVVFFLLVATVRLPASGSDVVQRSDVRGELFSVRVEDADVITLMRGLAHLGGFDFITYGSSDVRVSLWLRNRTLGKILETLSDVSGVEYRLEDGILRVYADSTRAAYTRVYSVGRSNASRTANVLQTMLGSPTANPVDTLNSRQPSATDTRIIAKPHDGEILVVGSPSLHRKVTRILPRLDRQRARGFLTTTQIAETAFITPAQLQRVWKFMGH